MRAARIVLASSALWATWILSASRAEAQAVAFEPGVGAIPDGVNLSVTPAVSADRRYVRLSLNANFSTINGFSSFPAPAAVAGGNGTGVFRGGLGGLGGLGGGGGGAGGGAAAGGGGFRNVMGGAGLGDSGGIPYNLEYLAAARQAAVQAKLEPAKPVKGKKALADPVMVPIKKGTVKAKPPRG